MADIHPGDGNAERLHRYWVHGEGAAKIRWGTPGDFDRCTRQLIEHAKFTPEQAHGYCNLAHHAALGIWPAQHAAMEKGHGRAGRVTAYTRSFPLEDISIRSGGDGRTVDAYAAVFDIPTAVHDQDGEYDEVLDKAAFNRAIADAAPSGSRRSWGIKVLYNHGMTVWSTPSELYSMPVGVPVEVRADNRGLFTRTRYLKGELGDQILEGIRAGSIIGYSFSGTFRRSDPDPPRGLGFRPDSRGVRPVCRRLESSLREYGPTPFPAYSDALITGIRAEDAAKLLAMMLSRLDPGERTRLADMFRTGAPLDSPAADAPDDSGLVAEDSRPQGGEMRSGRPPREEMLAQRARFLIRHGGGSGA